MDVRPGRPRRHRARAAALTLAAIAATGCGAAVAKSHASADRSHAAGTSTGPSTAPTTPAASSPAAAARPAAARTARFRIPSSESYPDRKREGVRVALALTTYAPGTTAEALARAVTTDPARRAALARSADPLLHRGFTSAGTIVYPQMGGATADRASIMVVVRQAVTGPDGARRVETRTLDIRLLRTPSGWQFDELASAGGTPVARPAALSAAARAVLDDPRITLPDSARWDIHRGAVAEPLLALMAQLAERAPYAVAVLETGHPHDVFGTGHASAHASGHAVDVYRLAGHDVIAQGQPGSRAYDVVTWLLAQPQVRQVGSPWNLDGGSSRSFTNGVHLDHVHIAV